MNSGSIEEEEKDNSNSEEKEEKEKIRPINIDYKMASRQKKLNILGIEIYFPYEPYENQILYMKKVIEALQTRGMAGLESPTGTGKTLCLLCACLGYLKHLREELNFKIDYATFTIIENRILHLEELIGNLLQQYPIDKIMDEINALKEKI